MSATQTGTVTGPAGFPVSDIIALVRLWLSDPDIGDPQNPGDQEPRWDTASLIRYLNSVIDDVNTRRPDFGLVDATTYTVQGHVSAVTDTLSYPTYLTETLAHRVAALALTEDSSDKAGVEEAQRHNSEYEQRIVR